MMKTSMLRKTRILGIVVIACALVLSVSLPALAQGSTDRQWKGFSGTLTSVGDEAITVETKSGEVLAVGLSEETMIVSPSGGIMEPSEVELTEGAEVAVLAWIGPDDTLNAYRILVKPEQPRYRHVIGVPVTIEGDVVTLADYEGNMQTLQLQEQIHEQLRETIHLRQLTTLAVRARDGEGQNP